MSYRRTLITRWNQRDRLAVVVLGVAVAFLVGTTLLVLAAGGQTATIAAGLEAEAGVDYHGSVAAARAAAGPETLVLPVAAVTVDGHRRIAVGVPGSNPTFGKRDIRLGAPGTLGTIDRATTRRFEGRSGTATVPIEPRDEALFPPSWYALERATVMELGPTGALTIGPSRAPATPLLSGLSFFVLGTEQVLRTLTAAAVGTALLVAVTIHAVTRMTVRDRRRTIRVVRATGGGAATVLGVFAVRAALLTAVGAALGYALGTIATNAAVSLGVTLGVPTSLAVRVTPTAGRLFVGGLLAIIGIGAAAGALAAWPVVRRPAGSIDTDPADTGGVGPFTTTVLDWRALLPTGASLTAFTTFVVLIAGIAGAVAPAGGGAAVITQPGSSNPITSRVPAGYADALAASGIDASPEVLLFLVHEHRPFLGRGVEYDRFAAVTDAALIRGRPPGGADEAVIGADLARTLGVGVGDRLTIGGSTRAAIARVEIAGVYRAAGYRDDQLLVSLPVARRLADVPAGSVHLVRADRLPRADVTDDDGAAVLTDLTAPGSVVADETFTVGLTLRNPGPRPAAFRIRVRYGEQSRLVSGTVPAEDHRRVRVSFAAGTPGTRSVRAGPLTRELRVLDPETVRLLRVPDRAPPGSEPLIRVVGPDGAPANATVVVGDRTYRTDDDGRVRLLLPTSGPVSVEARRGDQSDTARIAVVPGAGRALVVETGVRPSRPSVLDRPSVEVGLFNPWNRTVNRTVTIDGPGTSETRAVTLPPGGSVDVSATLGRASPGEHRVRVGVGNRTRTVTYTVADETRVVSAIATAGRQGESGVSRGIAVAFGNLQLVAATVLALASLMSVGATTATFASAVHARRRTLGIHRATGAPPWRILRIVLADAVRVGAVAALLAAVAAVGVLTALSSLGYLTVFGVTISPVPPVSVVGPTVFGALVLAVISAALATVAVLDTPPGALLDGASDSDRTGR